MRSKVTGISLALAVILAALTAHGDGLIIPVPSPGRPLLPPLSIKYHHVTIHIHNQVARTEVDQVFKNNSGTDLEGTYIFPIPEEAAINDFTMFAGGERIAARLLDKESALKTYEDIVKREKDPALLEYAGRAMFKARVYPIPGFGEKRIGLVYDEFLKNDGGLCAYRYTLNTEKFSADPLEDVSVNVVISSRVPILSIYSPTHEIQVERESATRALVTYHERKIKPDKDFILYYKLSKKKVDVSMMTFKERGKDGYFLLLLSPNSWEVEQEILPKDVLFVFDRSGSMNGAKIEQAASSLLFCLNSLNEEDRFGLITFNDAIDEFAPELVPVSRKNVEEAKSYVRTLSAAGGTHIDGALARAAEMMSRGSRPKMILFLTDGLPTVGITDVNEILSKVKAVNSGRARVFAFGVGYDVNTRLLDRLATENRGSTEYVRPNEDIEMKVSSLYSKIMNPILTEMSLDFGTTKVFDVYPRELPDLFKGSQMVLTGRYKGSGASTLTLNGNMSGARHRFKYRVSFGQMDRENEFVPLLWASRRIGFLVEEMRSHGSDNELVREIVRLSKRFGILTEYTSYLVDKDVTVALDRVQDEARREIHIRGGRATGQEALYQSVNAEKMKRSARVQGLNQYYDAEGVHREFDKVTQLGNKAFFNQGGSWMETSLESSIPTVVVQRYSEAYFQILRRDPSTGPYLALGKNVTFRVGMRQIRIADGGKQSFTERELDELLDWDADPRPE
jgi:Ca-activated chloride channel family protein